jgi:dihydroorotate dehydrogenase electron transfer subunit
VGQKKFNKLKQVLSSIISNTEPMPGYRLICANAPDIAATARAGQFVMVKCGEELTLRRPLSIHKIADSSHLYFLFKLVGKGTGWLSQHHKGERLDLLGPLGNSFSIEPTSKNILLVAGGIGIAPLTLFAQQALNERKSVKLLLGARTADVIYPEEYLPRGLEAEFITEDGSAGKTGMVSKYIKDYVGWADQVYACGPMAMYKAMAEQRRQWREKKPVQISLEIRLGCGLGACYSCSIKTKHGMKKVCHDGPVFNLDNFDEQLLQEVKI